ncbi:MAG: hypothetical protein M5U28_27940 [Sandaracinaceae bacterium]|nr:hypothetical protein [Sandaracinaceae bacterium]
MRAGRGKQFYVYVVDEDRGLFTIRGPMRDDTAITDRVSDAQDAGRRMHCFSRDLDAKTLEALVREYEVQTGLKYTTDALV